MPDSNLDKYFLASIVECCHDSIITINLERVITSWNKAAEQLYGYRASEAIGKSLTMLTLPEDFNEILSNIDKIKHSKEVAIFRQKESAKAIIICFWKWFCRLSRMMKEMSWVFQPSPVI